MTENDTSRFGLIQSLLIIAAVAAGVSVLAVRSLPVSDMNGAKGKQPAAEASTAQYLDLTETQANAIEVLSVSERDFILFKNAIGTIDFNQNKFVQVFSQYQGKILSAFFNVGDDVKQGDLLFTIDSPDLVQAESALLASAGVLELQRRVLTRLTQLLKAGGTAQKDVDQATSDQQTAEGNAKAARDAVKIFGKSDDEIDQIIAQRQLDSTLRISSPISGRVVARNAAPGLLTLPGNAPAPYTIADLSTMWMIANVIETDAPAYRLGQEVEVRVPAYPDMTFKGRVTTLGTMIDPSTRRQLVRSEIDDPQHLLRAGMFASFVIRTGDPVRSPSLPAEGVVREGDGTMTVWVTSDRRRFFKRTVKTGLRQDGWVQVLDGLQPGEQAVSNGAVFLSNKLLIGING